MLRIGEYNKMKVDREKDFGFYLRELDGRAEVLLPKSLLEGNKVSVGDEVEVFIYRDSKSIGSIDPSVETYFKLFHLSSASYD